MEPEEDVVFKAFESAKKDKDFIRYWILSGGNQYPNFWWTIGKAYLQWSLDKGSHEGSDLTLSPEWAKW